VWQLSVDLFRVTYPVVYTDNYQTKNTSFTGKYIQVGSAYKGQYEPSNNSPQTINKPPTPPPGLLYTLSVDFFAIRVPIVFVPEYQEQQTPFASNYQQKNSRYIRRYPPITTRNSE